VNAHALLLAGGALGAAALIEYTRARRSPSLPTCKDEAAAAASALRVGAGLPATCTQSSFAGAEASSSASSSTASSWWRPLFGLWGVVDGDPRHLFGAAGGADELADDASIAAARVERALKTLAIVAGAGVALYVAWEVVTR